MYKEDIEGIDETIFNFGNPYVLGYGLRLFHSPCDKFWIDKIDILIENIKYVKGNNICVGSLIRFIYSNFAEPTSMVKRVFEIGLKSIPENEEIVKYFNYIKENENAFENYKDNKCGMVRNLYSKIFRNQKTEDFITDTFYKKE